jgi:hypothetical protein
LQLFGNVEVQITPSLGGGQIEMLAFPIMQLANDLQQLGTKAWIDIVSHDIHFLGKDANAKRKPTGKLI